MQRFYKYSSDIKFKGFFDTTMSSVYQDFPNFLNIASNLLLELFPNQSFYFVLETKNWQNNEYYLHFKIKNIPNVYLDLVGNYINIFTPTTDYTFLISSNIVSYNATLVSLTSKNSEQIITESIYNHRYNVSIRFQDRLLCLEIPLEINNFLGTEIYSSIKASTTISELKAFYMQHFYPQQKAYNRKESTILSIFDLESNANILIDELVLREGFIAKYILSTKQGQVLIRMEGTKLDEGKITIINYHLADASLDLKAEISKLERKL